MEVINKWITLAIEQPRYVHRTTETTARQDCRLRGCQLVQFGIYFLRPLDEVESGPYSGQPTYEYASARVFPLAVEQRYLLTRYRALVLEGVICVLVAAPNKHQPFQPQPTARRKHDICGTVNYM